MAAAYHNTCSSMRIENEAITQVLNWLMTQNVQWNTIITDSQSPLRKAEHSTLRKEWLDIVYKMQNHMGHSGIVGNEKEDQLAAKINPLGNISLDKQNI